MHRIDTAGSVSGQFSDGDPASGVRGARIGADWLNDLQANLFAVLAEGRVGGTRGRAEDLRDAIAAMVAGAVGTGDGSVPTTRTLTVQGLVRGGGTLAANRDFDVPKATAAEVDAGARDDAAITPAALAGMLAGRSFTAIGLVKGGGSLAAGRQFDVTKATVAEINAGTRDDAAITPAAFAQALGGAMGAGTFRFGPLVIKWGSVQGSYGEGAVYTGFTEAFPTECYGAWPVVLNNTAGNTRDFGAQLVGLPTTAGFTTMLQRGGGSTANTIDGFVWFALGR